MQDGFLFDELTDFKKELMVDVKKNFPKETQKFIKKEASKLTNVAKKIAKSEVGTSKGQKKNWIEAKSYHKSFRVGKTYDYSGDLCCRAYNKAPHAHLIENGHVNGRKFTAGKFVFHKAEMEFENEYLKDSDEFLGEYFDNI